MFAKEVQEYMADQCDLETYTQSPTLSAFPQDMSHKGTKPGAIWVPVTQAVVDLLTALMEHIDNLKGSSVNKVLCLWPAHYRQFGQYVTKMSDKDWDMLQIAGPKIIQGKIDAITKEKELQATADEVSLSQLGVRQSTLEEANSEAIDLSTFNVKTDIKSALSVMEEAKAALKDLGLGCPTRNICKHLCKTSNNLKSAWEHTQVTSLANSGIKYASIAMVDVWGQGSI